MDYFILGCILGFLLSIAISLIKLDEDLKRESEKENDTDNE